jgi:2-aminoethylphosphonate-pyruvate transaminase
MCELASGLFEKNRKLDYEYVFVEVSKDKKIFVRKEEDFVWCEIDDESHYQRALSRIYPKLK